MKAVTPATERLAERARHVADDRARDVVASRGAASRARAAVGCGSRASTQLPPLPSMKPLRIRIVISANSELTMPRPMSDSTPAAPPSLAGQLLGLLLSLSVMS